MKYAASTPEAYEVLNGFCPFIDLNSRCTSEPGSEIMIEKEECAKYIDDTRAVNDYFENLKSLRRMSIFSQFANDAKQVSDTMSKQEIIQGVLGQPYRGRDIFKRLHYLPKRGY